MVNASFQENVLVAASSRASHVEYHGTTTKAVHFLSANFFSFIHAIFRGALFRTARSPNRRLNAREWRAHFERETRDDTYVRRHARRRTNDGDDNRFARAVRSGSFANAEPVPPSRPPRVQRGTLATINFELYRSTLCFDVLRPHWNFSLIFPNLEIPELLRKCSVALAAGSPLQSALRRTSRSTRA